MKYLLTSMILIAGCGCEIQAKDDLFAEVNQVVPDCRECELAQRPEKIGIPIVDGEMFEQRMDIFDRRLSRLNSKLDGIHTIIERYRATQREAEIQQSRKALTTNGLKKRPPVEKLKKKSPPVAFTGALVYHTKDCPHCQHLLKDFDEKARPSGWKIGPNPVGNHFVLIDGPPDRGGVPQIVYYKNGNEVMVIEGYGGNLNEVLNSHPSVKRKPNNPPQFQQTPQRRPRIRQQRRRAPAKPPTTRIVVRRVGDT